MRKGPKLAIPPSSRKQAAALDELEKQVASDTGTMVRIQDQPPLSSSKKQRKKGEGSLRSTERGTRFTLLIPDELAAKLRVFAAKEKRSMSDVVTAALAAYID